MLGYAADSLNTRIITDTVSAELRSVQELIDIRAQSRDNHQGKTMIKAYSRTQTYFCQSISKSYLNLSESTTAYFTGVPETHLNFLTIDQTPMDLEKDLNAGKTFFATFNQSFIALNISMNFGERLWEKLKKAGILSATRLIQGLQPSKKVIGKT